jgi:hypothetical protein
VESLLVVYVVGDPRAKVARPPGPAQVSVADTWNTRSDYELVMSLPNSRDQMNPDVAHEGWRSRT